MCLNTLNMLVGSVKKSNINTNFVRVGEDGVISIRKNSNGNNAKINLVRFTRLD